MKISTIDIDGSQRVGVLLSEDRVLDLTSASGQADHASVLDLLDAGESALKSASVWRDQAESGEAAEHVHALSSVTLLAPIPRPRNAVFCVGLNYRSHVEQNAAALGLAPDIPDEPLFFGKPVHSVVGPDQAVHLDSRLTSKLDYEIELAAVIGRGGSWIDEADALDHVAGWTIGNDVSARDLQWRNTQFFYGKGQDTYCPVGPWITTSDEMPDLKDVLLELLVNGEVRQQESAGNMIFGPARAISELSKGVTLEPGDIILLGTPGGCGYQMIPTAYLAAGDVIESRATGIGTLRNPVVEIAP